MTRHKRNQFSAQQFAERFVNALESNPNAPPKFHGERIWVVEELLKRGLSVTQETVRKWTVGDTMPTHEKIPPLADVLGVDADWLLYGSQSSDSAKARVKHDVDAAAATNLLSGIMQLAGVTVNFPAEKVAGTIHLHAVIGKVSYPLHIVVGHISDGELEAVVPAKQVDAVILCIVPSGEGFAYNIYEIGDDALAGAKTERGGRVVKVPVGDLKQVRSFTERL